VDTADDGTLALATRSETLADLTGPGALFITMPSR